MKKIYLVGPDHLLPNGKQFYKQAHTECVKHGFELIMPPEELFNPISSKQEGFALAKKRIEQLKTADIVIANTNDYKDSVEPYGESSFLLGYANALNIRTYCYMDDTRVCGERYKFEKQLKDDGRWYDENNIVIESQRLNLMLDTDTTIIQGNLTDVLKYIEEYR